MKPGEHLQSCPRCTSPSRVKPTEQWAQCSRISCQFAFCVRCLCDLHPKGARCKSASKLPTSSRKSSKTELIFPEIAAAEREELRKGTNHSGSSVNSEPSLSPIGKVASKTSSSSRVSKDTVAGKKSRNRLKRL